MFCTCQEKSDCLNEGQVRRAARSQYDGDVADGTFTCHPRNGDKGHNDPGSR